MSEIDVDKYMSGDLAHYTDPITGITWHNAKFVEQLKAENEELRARNSRGMLAFLEEDFKKEQKIKKYKQCIDEIEEICNECQKHTDNVCETCKYCDKCINDFITNDVTNFILQKIKEVKGE